MQYCYPCVLTPEEEGGFWVRFPDVPGALTGGKDRAEALEMAGDALLAALGAHVRQSKDIPAPSAPEEGQEMVPVSAIAAAKLALYTAMRDQGITKVALAARLGLSDTVAHRLLNPDHRSPIGQVEKALRAVGRSLVIEDKAAA